MATASNILQDKENYAAKFGMTNILTPEEKASYKKFAQKVHELPHKELFKLYSNQADELTSEMQDIVAWEMKIRELEIFKKQNIDPNQKFKPDNYFKQAEYDDNAPNLNKYKIEERYRISEMTDELLENSKRIIENTAVKVNSNNLHSRDGGGVNILAKQYIVEDNNGNEILIDNNKMQEHFRKMYMKRMSEVTGIDYTKYDESPDIDYSENLSGPNVSNNQTTYNMGYDTQARDAVNMNDYEDD